MITDNKYKPSDPPEWLSGRLWGGGGGCPFTEGPLVGGGGGFRPGWPLELPPWLLGVADAVLVGGGGGGAFILDWGVAEWGPLVGGGGGLAEGDPDTCNYSQTSLNSMQDYKNNNLREKVGCFCFFIYCESIIIHGVLIFVDCVVNWNHENLNPMKQNMSILTVFKITNSRIHGTMHFAETTKIGANE
jgi:hypothetical protein